MRSITFNYSQIIKLSSLIGSGEGGILRTERSVSYQRCSCNPCKSDEVPSHRECDAPVGGRTHHASAKEENDALGR